MQTVRKDPLLAAAKVIIVLIQIVMIFAIVMLGIGIGALLSVQNLEIVTKLTEAGAPTYAIWLIVSAMVLIMALLAMAWRFFQELAGIVQSVGAEDPFHAENADRLTRMGWISVAAHLLTLALIGIAAWFAPYTDKAWHGSNLGFEIEPTGVLLTVILFILARVFKRGAEMREELEGTV